MNKLIYSVIFALSLVTGALAYDQNDVSVFVVGSATTHQLDLKTIEGESQTRNFITKPQSVVQVKQGDNLVVFTQPINQVDKVKVTNANDVMTTLTPLGNNAYSLSGFLTGAYILDVIVNTEGGRAAHETILVILEKDQPKPSFFIL